MSCQYHTQNNAIWQCSQCAQELCGVCIPGGEENFKRGHPRCPLCVTSLTYLGNGEQKEPFWRISTRFFRYAGSPTLLIMAALAGALSNMLFIIALFFNVVIVRYGLMVIERLSHGDWQQPKIGDAISGDLTLFFKQIGVLAVMFAVPALMIGISPILGYGLLFLAVLGVPASIMTLAMTESALSALNPACWLRLMWTIGWPYLVLWLAWTSVISAPSIASTFLADATATAALDFISGFLGFYCSVVGFAMMGYLLYEHAEKLGIGTSGARGKDLPPIEFSQREALGVSHIYAQNGRIDEAKKVVENALNSAPADIALHERKFMLLKLQPQAPRFLSFAADYLRLLCANQKTGMAVAAYLDICQSNPQFIPAEPAVRMQLAKGLAARQKWREAKILLVNLHSQHPRYEELGEAYVLLARVYLESTNNADSAGKILGFLRKNFPNVLEQPEGQEVTQLYSSLSAS